MAKTTSKSKKTLKTPVVPNGNSYMERIENELNSNQSKVSLVLGTLIVLVIGILVFNYFSKSQSSLGPAQQTEGEQDVLPEGLPGKYTVKDGDTLFTIADKYFQDGYKYTEIAKANNMTNPDQIETGQVLEIPELEVSQAQAEATPEASPETTPEPQDQTTTEALGTGGGNETIWGPKIDGDAYTVVKGDWLSKIAGRAYGDIYAFDKIAQANNISNPDLIEPGTILTIPR
ncbi:LysM peptidoglycan-binding domain-containing protein [Patescibacteria group bacterium]|nr:LysM peptidoglycan-binding domain-containing protein [Patescibacteria group bacterium]